MKNTWCFTAFTDMKNKMITRRGNFFPGHCTRGFHLELESKMKWGAWDVDHTILNGTLSLEINLDRLCNPSRFTSVNIIYV